MTDAKGLLRAELRANPPTGDDSALCRSILEHPWVHEASVILAYAPMPVEPQITPVLLELLRQGKTLLLPRCETGHRMTARRIESLSQLVPDTMGILEPPETLPVVPKEQMELILNPGLAFDVHGGRLGRGAGFYDRFLCGCPARRLAVGYNSMLLPEIPMDVWDQRMDGIVTETGGILCRMEDGA